jgi:hypothetical protein
MEKEKKISFKITVILTWSKIMGLISLVAATIVSLILHSPEVFITTIPFVSIMIGTKQITDYLRAKNSEKDINEKKP